MALGVYDYLKISRGITAAIGIASTVIAALVAHLSPLLGRDYLLWAPIWLGTPLLLVFAVLEVITRTSGLAGAVPKAIAVVTWFALVAGSVVVVAFLWIGWSTPLSGREYNYFGAWPLFTWLNLALFVGVPLLVALTLKSILWLRKRRAI